jgi:hypothetical protein
MLSVIGSELDVTYIAHWAAEVGMADLWQTLWDEYRRP